MEERETTERHKVWVEGFSRIRDGFEFEAPEALTPLDAARAKATAAKAAGAYEHGWFATCASSIGGCGWRGPDRATEDEARADARDHDAKSYGERALHGAKASGERLAKRARNLYAAARQPYHEATLDRLYGEVLDADAAWEADLSDRDLAREYRAAKARFRAAEKQAIADGYTTVCGRCGGTGYVPPWGTCFACHGFKRQSYRPQTFAADPSTRAKRRAKAEKKKAAEDAAYQDALAELPEGVARALVDADEKLAAAAYDQGWDALSREENFRAVLAGKLRKYGSLSEKQVAAVERGLANDRKRAEEKEALKDAPPLEAGRRVVEGEILTDKWTEDRGYGAQHKILVRQDDGNKVWGTVPRAIEDATRPNVYAPGDDDVAPKYAELRGARVRFTATVERSKDDPHFGFFKRPAKAEVIA